MGTKEKRIQYRRYKYYNKISDSSICYWQARVLPAIQRAEEGDDR